MEAEVIARRVRDVRERMAAAAARSGRPPEAVRLVAATKTRTVEEIVAVIRAGVVDLGENRAQELVAKAPDLVAHDPTWHFIGRLQRNKINQLRPWVSWWHSIDDLATAEALTVRAERARVLIEVNVAGEERKGGCEPSEAAGLAQRLRAGGAEVVGLMTVAPAVGDPRPIFASLRTLAEALELAELSMGMSGDFEAAIEEGATIVRVGTGLFGHRADIPPKSRPGAVT